MRGIVWLVVIILTTIIQAAIVPLVAINNTRPDLLLIVVVSSSLLLGKEHGVGTGFFAGLIQDLAAGGIFGVSLISKLGTGFLFGLAEQKVFKEHILLPILAVAAATILSGLLSLTVMNILGYKVEWLASFTGIVLPMMLYNMVLSIPIHKAVFTLSRRLTKA